MTIYHAQDYDGYTIGKCRRDAEDVLVPIEEVESPGGRWINCPQCAEAMARKAGGSLRRRTPVTIGIEVES